VIIPPTPSPHSDLWICGRVFICMTLVSLTPDGMYGNFAGRDASRGMAKQSFDDGELY